MKLSLASTAFLAVLSLPAAAIDVQFAPGADARTYKKVLIAPARVEFQPEFLNQVRTSRDPTMRLRPDEVRDLARDMGDDFSKALAEAFRKRGYEIVPAPGGDVLSISPALRNLYVNAPDAQTAGLNRSYVREAGGALMVAEASGGSGQRVASASEESTTSRSIDFEPANRVTNRFRFEAMFRAWADEFAGAIAGR
jgi:hypothetical protein